MEYGASFQLNLTLDEARGLAEQAGVIPLVGVLPGDLLTPVGAFLRLAHGKPYAFLLESVEGGERIGRYSFLGFDPWVVVVSARASEAHAGPAGKERGGGDPLRELRAAMKDYCQAVVPDLPPFTGGIVGNLAYDAVRSIERLPSLALDDLEAPDLDAAFYDTVVAFDRLRQRIQIVVNLLPGRAGRTLADEYERGRERINEIVRALAGPLPGGAVRRTGESPHSPARAVRESLTRAEFESRVRSAQQEIARGEIFQVVLSRRMEREFEGDPFSVYRALRAINPSPYHFYLRQGTRALAGASPEMLVRVRDGVLETRPIAGTRRRGADEEEDAILAAELLADPKERAEHLMLVDLGRNDLGRVSAPGTVKVRHFAGIERYSHVMHLVSSVEGVLREGCDSFDALLACFPAGTVSGAPKVRAMEIIEGLEPTRRGPYAGAVFYRGFDGSLDSAIAIRVVLVKEGRAYVQAGAGIVADSDPESEFRETEGKARAALAALDRAEDLS